jgi:hypothetical protein
MLQAFTAASPSNRFLVLATRTASPVPQKALVAASTAAPALIQEAFMVGPHSRLLRVLAATVAVVLALLVFPGAAEAATATVVPGTMWTDTAGNRLQAHGAGILRVGSTYYMVGEDKVAGSTFTAVACYSSTDLVHWTRQANALSRQASGDLGPGRIVERPKVIYNSTTGKYVLWTHIDNTSYSDQRAGVAISDTPCGPYTYLGATRPLGHPSRDLGLFKDDDGIGYLIHEDPAAGMRIERLSADYTSAQSTVATFASLEVPTSPADAWTSPEASRRTAPPRRSGIATAARGSTSHPAPPASFASSAASACRPVGRERRPALSWK